MSVLAKNGDAFVLTYDLFSLPTAQHKAGLAGLLLMIDTLNERKIEPAPVVEEVSSTGARLSFTRPALGALFDDLYDSSLQEVKVKDRRAKEKPKRIEEVEVTINGKIKKEKKFVYDAVVPTGAFLNCLMPDAGDAYVKLFRDLVWNTLRGSSPASRQVYRDRANGKPCSLSAKFWSGFEKTLALRKKGKVPVEDISSSMFIGAEERNAEKVPFLGSFTDNFLLHFWPIVSLIFVPRTLGIERDREQGLRVSRSETGFVLSIPEPAELDYFRDDMRAVLKRLDPETRGFRPRASLIDVHEEGGLEYLYHLAKDKTRNIGDFECSVYAVELFHLQRDGKRTRHLGAGRIVPNEYILKDYALVRDEIHNPIFKSIVLRNIMDGERWYYRFDAALYHHPMPVFISCRNKTPKEVAFLGLDVRGKFRAIKINLATNAKGGVMDENVIDDQLSLRIYRLIQTYVNVRSEEKSGKRYEDFSKQKDANGHVVYPEEYRESRERVCSDAFLAMRGRRGEEFIEYFTGTICSVPQYMKQEEYTTLGVELIKDWEKIKVLSMLAMSAHSYLPGNSKNKEEE
ncbi:MAG: type I-MYXAN CRISPR-associated protein Cmx8 [Deltaproteobacteria bacterium]|nr:type I-MYXAN CRISPR-associated protein Cmx8 [Deltaproteobacteria bacterium]